jgi:TonB-dependent starch-binding outer membrane protein SusC
MNFKVIKLKNRAWFSRRVLWVLLLVFNVMTYPTQIYADNSTAAIDVTGTVLDAENNEPIPGVSIVVENTTQGTITDEKGNFSLKVADKNAFLLISFVGFEKQRILVGDQTNITISLISGKILEEVVVIGYGESKKSDLTGSVGQIKTQTVEESGYSNFQQAIAGRVAGVVVSETSGQPGSALTIEIRGASSLSFSTQPLYVIDGIPLEDPNVGALNNNAYLAGVTAASPLASINPNDIASLEILKDASATAIYGSRGSNGVVLITTKSGQKGKPKVSFNYSISTAQPLREVDVLGGQDYARLMNEIRKVRSPTDTFVPYLESDFPKLVEFNPQKAATISALTSDANLSLSGGDNRSKYYLSGQYYYQQGLVKSTDFKRYNFRATYENDISARLKLNTSLTYTNSQSNGNLSSSILQATQRWAPINPFYNPDGSVNVLNRAFHYGSEIYDDAYFGRIYYNPRFPITEVINGIVENPTTFGTNPALLIDGKVKGGGIVNINNNNQIIGNTTLSYKLTENLKLSGVFGVTSYNAVLENYLPSTLTPSAGGTTITQRGVASIGNLQSLKLLYQTTLSYDKKIKKHNINAVIGATAEKFTEKRQNMSSQGFVNDFTGVNNIQAGQTPQVPVSNYNGYQLVSSIFRTSYNYAGRYYLTFSARYDGSSKFTEDNRFGFFPSIGGSWRVANEKIFKKVRALSELKLRASYGIIGNQALGPYNTLATLSNNSVIFGNNVVNAAYFPSRLPNRGLSWESTKQANIGLDFGLFKNRIDLQVDIYRKITDDLLYNVDLPGTTGFSTQTKNVASITNEGLEIALTTMNVKTKALSWSTSFNVAFNRGVVNRLAGNQGEFLGINQLVGNTFLFTLRPGESIGQFVGLKTLPVWNEETIKTKPATFQSTAKEGDIRYADLNNDGLLTNDDRVNIGSALPKFTGGMRTELTYKSFSLNGFLNFSYGNKIFNQNAWTMTDMSGTNANNVYQRAYDNRYIILSNVTDNSKLAAIKANNLITKTPSAGALLDRREVADYYVEDGSFIRLKDINIGYTVPNVLLKKLKVNTLKVYVNLQNMATWTNYTGLNPEVNTGSLSTRGLDNGVYPLFKNYRFGVNATF